MNNERQNFDRLKSEAGSAMILALTAVALLGLMASATLTVSSMLSSEAQRKSQADLIGGFAQSLETLVTNPYSCAGTTTGPQAQRLDGLKFKPSGSPASQACDSNCLNRGRATGANSLGHLDVTIDTPFASGNAGIASAGRSFSNQGVKVDSLYLQNVQYTVNGVTTTATGELIASLSSLTPAISFAPRKIADVNMSFSSGTMISCSATPSPEAICENMGCIYNESAPAGTQRCKCSLPDLDCQSVNPRSYIDGYDPVSHAPRCRVVGFNCRTTMGDGYFFAGIDHNGDPICLAAEGVIGATPTPAPTPVPVPGVCGTSNGQTFASAPTSGFCSVGAASAVTGTGPWRWTCAGAHNGADASCSANPLVPINGVCGPSNNQTFASAPTSGLCSSSGGSTSVIGTGPWTWTCRGSNGGSNASCATQLGGDQNGPCRYPFNMSNGDVCCSGTPPDWTAGETCESTCESHRTQNQNGCDG